MARRPLFRFSAPTLLSNRKVMRTKRLTLRPLQHDDAERIAVLGGDWDVASMTGRIPYPYSAEAAQHWLTGVAHGEVVLGIWQATHSSVCAVTARLPADRPNLATGSANPIGATDTRPKHRARLWTLASQGPHQALHVLPLHRQPCFRPRCCKARLQIAGARHGLVRGASKRSANPEV